MTTLFTLFAFDIGAPELLIVLAIVLLLFGTKKLPELTKGIADSAKELRGGASELSKLKEDLRGQVSKAKSNISNDIIKPVQQAKDEISKDKIGS